MRAFLNRLFRLEEISGDGLCPTYLYRWTLLATPWLKVYLHHFVGDDWARDLHDHPKRFISIGLWGEYIEETPGGRWEVVTDADGVMVRVRWSNPDVEGRYLWVRHYPNEPWGQVACEREAQRFNEERRWPGEGLDAGPSERTFRAPWIRTFPADHVHRLRARNCWTLVVVGRPQREWGFWLNGQWVAWRTYLERFGAERKGCA